MKPATSTKLALFCCYFYSTAGAVMQVFFYKTVTFWGCVDEVTEFCCCFWLFCTIEMGRRASAASPQGDWLAGRYRGERSEPAGGLACGEVPGRAQRARRGISLRGGTGASAASPQGDRLVGRYRGRAQRARRGIDLRGGTGGERSEPAGGSACGERTRRPARAVGARRPPQGGRPPLLRRRGGAGCCGVQGIKKQTPCK